MTPQERRVLDYMKANGSITQKQSTDDLGVSRLASRVSSLRKSGYPIVKEWEYGVNRWGDKVHWARYRLEMKRPVVYDEYGVKADCPLHKMTSGEPYYMVYE